MEMKPIHVINEGLAYIDKNLDTALTVFDIANQLGYSEYHFSRIFKAEMKMPVMAYVRKRRLIHASADIIEGQKILDVALRYGWSSHAGFTKAFKKEFGFSPVILKAFVMQMNQLEGDSMGHVFLHRTDENTTKEQLYEILAEKMNHPGKYTGTKDLEKVYAIALKAYEGVRRYSGEEYITHPLHVAILLTEMEAEESVVLAGLLCDVFRKGKLPVNVLEKHLPSKVRKIITELENFNPQSVDINMQEDAVLVKLAERLHNMRTIGFMGEEAQKEKAKETAELFLPIARKLGNKKLADELNDLALCNMAAQISETYYFY